MNNNRRRNFRPRAQKNNFRRRNGSLNSGSSNNFNNNGNVGFGRNGSINNIHNVEKAMLKFQQLAKDAQSNGDPVLAQNYLQHADHYLRRYNFNSFNFKLFTRLSLQYLSRWKFKFLRINFLSIYNYFIMQMRTSGHSC